MNRNIIGVALISLAAYLTYADGSLSGSNGSDNQPLTPATAFDRMAEETFANGNPDDVKYIGNVCLAVADRLRADGTRPTPVVTSRQQIRNLIDVAGKLAIAGKTEGKYPKLPGLIVEGFKPFGIEPGALTLADRTTAIECWTTIGNSCIRAARVLEDK